MSAALEIDHYNAAVEAIIGQCGGGARGAMKALLSANELLEADLAKALRRATQALQTDGSHVREQ